MRSLTPVLFACLLSIGCSSSTTEPTTVATDDAQVVEETSTLDDTATEDTGSPPEDTASPPLDTSSPPLDTASAPDTSGSLDTAVADTAKPDTFKPVDTGPPACNAVKQGPYVDLNKKAENAPTMTGGTITDGRWVLTDYTEYNGPGGAKGFVTGGAAGVAIEITGATWQRVTRPAGGFPNRYDTSTATSAAGSIDVSVARTCPTALTEKFRYTATATKLMLLNGVGSTGDMLTFTKS